MTDLTISTHSALRPLASRGYKCKDDYSHFYCAFVWRKYLRNARSRIVELEPGAKFEALRQCRTLKGLKTEEIKELVPFAAPTQYARRATIFRDGDPAEFFYFAHQGFIKLHKGSPSGKNVTFVIATNGDTLNAATLSIKRHFLSAQAMTEATVVRIPRSQMCHRAGIAINCAQTQLRLTQRVRRTV